MAYNTDPGWIKNKQDLNRASSGEELRKALIANLQMLEGSHTFKVKKGARDWDPYHKVEIPPDEIEEGTNPHAKGWYEKTGDTYILTEDTSPVEGKTYYEQRPGYYYESEIEEVEEADEYEDEEP